MLGVAFCGATRDSRRNASEQRQVLHQHISVNRAFRQTAPCRFSITQVSVSYSAWDPMLTGGGGLIGLSSATTGSTGNVQHERETAATTGPERPETDAQPDRVAGANQEAHGGRETRRSIEVETPAGAEGVTFITIADVVRGGLTTSFSARRKRSPSASKARMENRIAIDACGTSWTNSPYENAKSEAHLDLANSSWTSRKWRRGDSNPGPRQDRPQRLRACSID